MTSCPGPRTKVRRKKRRDQTRPRRNAYLATRDIVALGLTTEGAGAHVVDHALAQRADGDRFAHGELLLSEVQGTSSGGVSPPRYFQSLKWLPQPRLLPPHRRLERSDFVLWNVAVRLPTRMNAGYRQENGRDLPSTFTVRCADMTAVRSSSGQNKLGSLVAKAPHFRFAAVISSPDR